MKKLLSLSALILFLASCSTSVQIAKRQHRGGYYIAFDKEVKSPNNSTTKSTKTNNEQYNEELYTTSFTDETIVFVNEENTPEASQSNSLAHKSKSRSTFFAKQSHKSLKANLKSLKSYQFKTHSTDDIDPNVMLILLILLAIIIPPVAVGIKKGWNSTDFIISLILSLIFIIGLGVFGLLASLAGLAAVIHALLIVFDVI